VVFHLPTPGYEFVYRLLELLTFYLCKYLPLIVSAQSIGVIERRKELLPPRFRSSKSNFCTRLPSIPLVSFDRLIQLTQHAVDRRARQPCDPCDLGDRGPSRPHLLNRGDLFVGYSPSPAFLRAAPGLALAPGNLLPSEDALPPELAFLLGDRRQDSGMEPPRWRCQRTLAKAGS
jgi:hypothetical protein